ncbi:uncharacterized protein B0H18DRAFT_483966 [Fomitopsis serialis]|uniref:uncharacterized protein n=1 Tax=Fomitopsis serialis TaxID=139415 RepID=UPI00200875FA|nr:uncharacterized protein B0H18DRAFT_483966 [Neoantrodia serialis]KAH9934677.1 hypothetical protein B0H18DRAFT_483966 [Neoantrodia serialis]
MTQPSIISVNLVTVAVESLLYGVFLALTSASFYILINRALSQPSSHGRSRLASFLTPVMFGSIAITVTVTAHWVMTVIRLFDAFVHFEEGQAALLYYSDLALTTEIVKTAFIIATVIISDILLVYRLWIVWGHNYFVIIIPSLTVVGLSIAGPGVVYQLSQLNAGSSVFVTDVNRWISADYSCTFVTNVYSTFGIAWKVWRVRQPQGSRSYGGGNLQRVLAMMVESAALYTSYAIFFFVAYQVNSNIQFTAIDSLCPIAGIAFTMINVRVGLGWAQRAHQSSQISSSGIGSRRAAEQSFAMRPVAVDITHVVHREDDLGQSVKIGADDYPV